MKVVIDTLDKIDGNCIPGVVEKMHNTFAKLFGRGKKLIISDVFIHDFPTSFNGVEVGAVRGQIMKMNPPFFCVFLGLSTYIVRPPVKNEVDFGCLWIAFFEIVKEGGHGRAIQCFHGFDA